VECNWNGKRLISFIQGFSFFMIVLQQILKKILLVRISFPLFFSPFNVIKCIEKIDHSSFGYNMFYVLKNCEYKHKTNRIFLSAQLKNYCND
jgi:hypothetical protein